MKKHLTKLRINRISLIKFYSFISLNYFNSNIIGLYKKLYIYIYIQNKIYILNAINVFKFLHIDKKK